MKNSDKRNLDVFIQGETIDLCAPSCDPEIIDQWYRWFNDSKTTRYLSDQGIYPNTPERQAEFYKSVINGTERMVLMIRPKGKEYLVGTVSLSGIDYRYRQCDLALVIGRHDQAADSMLHGIEAKCRMTEHAFEVVGIERINTYQVINLSQWQSWQILLGYRVEGLLRKKYRKGRNIYDVMVSGCLVEDYLRLKEERDGSLWPGKDKMFNLLKAMPKKSSIDRLQEWLKDEYGER